MLGQVGTYWAVEREVKKSLNVSSVNPNRSKPALLMNTEDDELPPLHKWIEQHTSCHVN